jgi:hypothetical protein
VINPSQQVRAGDARSSRPRRWRRRSVRRRARAPRYSCTRIHPFSHPAAVINFFTPAVISLINYCSAVSNGSASSFAGRQGWMDSFFLHAPYRTHARWIRFLPCLLCLDFISFSPASMHPSPTELRTDALIWSSSKHRFFSFHRARSVPSNSID